MERRRFIQAAAWSLVVPAVAGFGRARGRAVDADPAGFFFFDDRFETARILAAECRGLAAATAVQGDITDTWRSRLARLCLQSPLNLRGVTTESFHFCLAVLLAEKAQIESRIVRIDRDLHWWTIRSSPQIRRGSVT